MTRHVLNGHFVLFYGSTATEPNGRESQWQPATPVPDPTWTVLVLEFKDNEVGVTGVNDLNHYESGDIANQRLALTGNWEADASGNLTLAGGHMYCEPGLPDAVRDRLREVFSGAGIPNHECIFRLLSEIAPTGMEEAHITFSGTAGDSGGLSAGEIITIQGVGTLKVPTPVRSRARA